MTQLFLSYLAGGFKGAGVWTWNYRRAGWEGGEYALLDRNWKPTERAIRAGKIAQAAEKLRDELWAARKEPQVGVLYNWDSDAIWAATSLRGRDHFRHYPMQARVGVSRALMNGNIPWEHVTPTDLDAGLAPRYKVIYLPAQMAISQDLLAKLTQLRRSRRPSGHGLARARSTTSTASPCPPPKAVRSRSSSAPSSPTFSTRTTSRVSSTAANSRASSPNSTPPAPKCCAASRPASPHSPNIAWARGLRSSSPGTPHTLSSSLAKPPWKAAFATQRWAHFSRPTPATGPSLTVSLRPRPTTTSSSTTARQQRPALLQEVRLRLGLRPRHRRETALDAPIDTRRLQRPLAEIPEEVSGNPPACGRMVRARPCT